MDGEYEVEAIRGHRRGRMGQYYLLKWAGYPESENTWEHESNVNCPDLIAEYWARTQPSTAALAEIARMPPVPMMGLSPPSSPPSSPPAANLRIKRILGLAPLPKIAYPAACDPAIWFRATRGAAVEKEKKKAVLLPGGHGACFVAFAGGTENPRPPEQTDDVEQGGL
jgi:hypothetical protein